MDLLLLYIKRYGKLTAATAASNYIALHKPTSQTSSLVSCIDLKKTNISGFLFTIKDTQIERLARRLVTSVLYIKMANR